MKKIVWAMLLFFLWLSSLVSMALTADEWVAQGDAYLEAHDTVNAYQCYLNAYNLNNNHQGANFGLSILTLPHYLIDGGDNQVRNFLQDNGLSIIGNLYDLYFSSWNVEEKPAIPQMQNFVDQHMIPYLNQAITHSNKLSSGFSKIIKKEMQPYDAWKEGIIQMGDNEWNTIKVRITKTGNIIDSSWGREYLILPSNIQVGVKWKAFKHFDEISTIESISAIVTTPAGRFTNCVKVVIERRFISDGETMVIYGEEYYKKNLGPVKYYWYDNTGWIEKTELISYSVKGDGYFPLEVDNSWEYKTTYSAGGESTRTWVVTSVEEYNDLINNKDREWDYGDTLAYKGILNLLNGFLNFACAYNVDVDFNDIRNLGLKQLLDKYPSFLTLRQNGQTKLNNALTSFQNLLDCLIGSYDSIRNEVDSQSDDILVLPADGEFNYFKDDLRNLLSDLRALLNSGGADFDPTDLFLKFTYGCYGSPVQMPKRIDLSKFFTSPITRTNLQPLEFNENGSLKLSSLWNFDQSLNGVFPDMTKQEFVGYFKGVADLHNPVILDGNTIYLYGFLKQITDWQDISSIKIYRDTSPNVGINPGNLIVSLPPSQFFEFLDTSAPADTYYYNAVLNFKDGSYSRYDIRRAVRKLYVDGSASGIYKGTSTEPYKYIGLGVEYGNPGSTIYVKTGTYRLEDDPEAWRCLYIDKPLRIIGSCNSSWIPDSSGPHTIIDAENKWSGICLNWESAGSSIENFIIRNAEGNGIGVGSSNIAIKNCVVSNTQNYWGIKTWGDGTNILNCTIANNNGWYGGGISANYGNNISIKNSIITDNTTGLSLWNVSGLNFSYNDVWGNTTNYSGIPDQTGINGNIYLNPLFVNPGIGDYRLSENSPCKRAGENGVDMGAYVQKGNINSDSHIDISDVILCLRMVIGLDPVNKDLADMNRDNEVDIRDVILILRKAVGLD